MNKKPTKILLVMPLSTIDWGTSNAGGVDSVCQMFAEYISSNYSSNFTYRIIAIELLGATKQYDEVIQIAKNVEVVWIPRSKKILSVLSLPSLLFYMFKVRQQVKEYCPDVIHSHLWSSILLCSRAVPSVITVHSYKNIARRSVSKMNNFLYVELLPLIYKFFGHRIVCVGEALKEIVSKDIGKSVICIVNPIDADYFSPRLKIHENKQIKLVTCALLTPRKQIDKSIMLVKLLTANGVDCSLDIIGPASDARYVNLLKTKIEQENLTQSVKLLGKLNKPQIIEKYMQSDMGLFFSKEETFGLVPLEMLATGLPVLATRVGVLAEKELFFSSIGVNFVDVYNVTDLLIKALYILKNIKTIKVDVASLQQIYVVKNVVDQYKEIYQGLVKLG